MTIQSLIQAHYAQEEERLAAVQAQQEAEKADAGRTIQQALGEYEADFVVSGAAQYWFDDGRLTKMSVPVRLAHWKAGLYSFYLSCDKRAGGVSASAPVGYHQSSRNVPLDFTSPKLHAFLAKEQQTYDEALANRRKAVMAHLSGVTAGWRRKLTADLPGYRAASVEEALAVWASLMGLVRDHTLPGNIHLDGAAIDPEFVKEFVSDYGHGEDDVDADYSVWLSRQEQIRQQEKEEAEKQAALDKRIEEYVAAYQTAEAERQRLDEINTAALAELQKQYDEPTDYYLLTYAIVATDEEYGEKYIEKETAFVLYPEPDRKIFYRRLHKGELSSVSYRHVVQVEGPLTAATWQDMPSLYKRVVCSEYTIERAAIYLHWSDATNGMGDAVKDELAALTRLPDTPITWKQFEDVWQDWDAQHYIKRRIEILLGHDEIPF